MDKTVASTPAVELPAACIDFNKLHDALAKKNPDTAKAVDAATIVPEGEREPSEKDASPPPEPVADKA